MTDEALTAEDLAALTALDTPSVCNAIEIVMPERRAYQPVEKGAIDRVSLDGET